MVRFPPSTNLQVDLPPKRRGETPSWMKRESISLAANHALWE